jgi:hypothetical protein
MQRPESPELGDRYPAPTDAASDWETQEQKRHWRNAISSLDELIATAERVRAELIVEGLDASYVQFLIGGEALSRAAIQAEKSLVRLQGVDNGIVHRLALAQHAAEAAAADTEAPRKVDQP